MYLVKNIDDNPSENLIINNREKMLFYLQIDINRNNFQKIEIC